VCAGTCWRATRGRVGAGTGSRGHAGGEAGAGPRRRVGWLGQAVPPLQGTAMSHAAARGRPQRRTREGGGRKGGMQGGKREGRGRERGTEREGELTSGIQNPAITVTGSPRAQGGRERGGGEGVAVREN
jgi:hypothetical protein